MKTMDRYIARAFIGNYVLLLLIGVSVYIFADVLVNLDDFTQNPALSPTDVLLSMVDYYGSNLPLYYQQLGGVMLAIAAGFTFAVMLKSNEFIPLVASGVPLQRLAWPVLRGGFLLLLPWIANSELLVPAVAHRIVRQHGDSGAERAVAVPCVRDDRNAILVARELHVRYGLLRGVCIVAPDEQGAPRHLIRADSATYDPARHTWTLDRGAIQELSAATESEELGRFLRWRPLAEYDLQLAPEEIRLRAAAEWAELMSFAQLSKLLNVAHLPNRATVLQTRDIRITQPFLAFVLLLLAIPPLLTREPINVLAGGGRSLVLTAACFIVVFLSHSLSGDANFARYAIAAPVLIFGPLAVVRFANVHT
jgi:lipopolysaccharide export system permease protein